MLSTPNKEEIKNWFMGLQDRICDAISKQDGTAYFKEDIWNYHKGEGGGRTRLITKGSILEKAGVNFSAVGGDTPENILRALKLDKADFFATGVSIVMHPYNPYVPIIHMNVRYFEMSNGVYWFGGGIDLTPHYVDPEDATFFHNQLKKTCDQFDASYYPKFKKWADDYFFIKHRNETRGIGGIFFDHLREDEKKSKSDIWTFVQAVGETFASTYTHLMAKNAHKPYNEAQKQWQLIRRGRYVEFNLVYDKGTKFGLDTDGRTESILMSLPPVATWVYDHQPLKNSPEEYTLNYLKKDINWATC
jgi:coproporphyrinogen III oxidase